MRAPSPAPGACGIPHGRTRLPRAPGKPASQYPIRSCEPDPWTPPQVVGRRHHLGTQMPSGGVHPVPSGGVWSRRAVSWPGGPTRREQPASTRAVSTMMGHVPRRVGRDAGPVGSRALERQYRDRPASWRLVSSRRARIMADGTVSWFVGVDWGSEKHQVCLLDAARQVVGERAFRHGGAGLAALCDWLVSVADDPGLVAVAIEVPHWPVVDALLDR